MATFEDYLWHRQDALWEEKARQYLPPVVAGTTMLVCAEDLGTVAPCAPRVLHSLNMTSLIIQVKDGNKLRYVCMVTLLYCPRFSSLPTYLHCLQVHLSSYRQTAYCYAYEGMKLKFPAVVLSSTQRMPLSPTAEFWDLSSTPYLAVVSPDTHDMPTVSMVVACVVLRGDVHIHTICQR